MFHVTTTHSELGSVELNRWLRSADGLHYQNTTGRFRSVALLPSAWVGRQSIFYHCEQSEMSICAWARIDNALELADTLSQSFVDYNDTPKLILRAYQRWGTDAPARLVGDFAFVIANGREDVLFAARDPLGVRPLFFRYMQATPFGAAFATTIPTLLEGSEHSAEIDPKWLALFLAGQSMSCNDTAFRGIHKVPPGNWVRIDPRGCVQTRYHAFTEEASLPSMEATEIVQRYSELLESAVKARLKPHAVNGIEISGGLDSSTILGFACKPPGQGPLHGFGFAQQEDEAAAIFSVSQRTGLMNNHVFTGSANTSEEAAATAISILGHPAEHSAAISHLPFYKLAQTLGVTSLHSGFGGDEGVTNYAPNFLREMMAARRFRTVWRAGGTTLPERARYMVTAIRRRNRPSTYAENIMRAAESIIATLPLRTTVSRDYGIIDLIRKDAQYDWPIPTLSGFSIHMLQQPFVSTRTETCSLVAARFGVEYSWPLLDVPLIEFFLAAPTELKVSNRMGRALHRRAVEGIVPDDRRMAPSKYLGELVQPMPGFQTKNQPAEGKLRWQDLDPMLQECLDCGRVKTLNEQARSSDTSIGVRAAKRSLLSISTLNHWLTTR